MNTVDTRVHHELLHLLPINSIILIYNLKLSQRGSPLFVPFDAHQRDSRPCNAGGTLSNCFCKLRSPDRDLVGLNE